MQSSERKEIEITNVGSNLLAHSKRAEFTAMRGLVLDLFPFIFAASQRMSARAISDFLEKEQGVKLSAVTISKAIKEAAKNWNLYFDMIEPAARVFEREDKKPMREFLFKEQIFWKPFQNRFLKAAVKVVLPADVARAASVLRSRWFALDLEIRLKARPYIEDRLNR